MSHVTPLPPLPLFCFVCVFVCVFLCVCVLVWQGLVLRLGLGFICVWAHGSCVSSHKVDVSSYLFIDSTDVTTPQCMTMVLHYIIIMYCLMSHYIVIIIIISIV
jgi:hypothetical protein